MTTVLLPICDRGKPIYIWYVDDKHWMAARWPPHIMSEDEMPPGLVCVGHSDSFMITGLLVEFYQLSAEHHEIEKRDRREKHMRDFPLKGGIS